MMLYRIGIDVGGTNTDAALVKFSDEADVGQATASFKALTTADVTTGIVNAIDGLLKKCPEVSNDDLASLNIGTTHFINAIIQVDCDKLDRVGVLRLCGPYGREQAPFTEWPLPLRKAIESHCGYLSGGLNVDGSVIAAVSADEVRKHGRILESQGIRTVVVTGIFSTIDTAKPSQEEYVRQVLLDSWPNLDIICSRDTGSAPFIERENQAILNGSILRLAQSTIAGFQDAMRRLGLSCPLFLTANDGTVVEAHVAASQPIRTFASGATNSLVGAIHLARSFHEAVDFTREQVMIVDIGGTTSDIAAVSPSGLPRASSAVVKVGGVRTAFSMPEVLSIGLGGGSRIREHDDRITIGPDSVGNQLTQQSQCFGGTVLTCTDIAATSGAIVAGARADWPGKPTENVIERARAEMTKIMAKGIDAMKASDTDVTLLMVGGGAILPMNVLHNVKRCIKVPFADTANAVGAGIAKIGGEVDRVCVPKDESNDAVLEAIKHEAIAEAVKAGAIRDSIEVVQLEVFQLPYVSNRALRAIAKVTGTPSAKLRKPQIVHTKQAVAALQSSKRRCEPRKVADYSVTSEEDLPRPMSLTDLIDYKPNVSAADGTWEVSEVDLAFIYEGVGVLGVGGGGSARSVYLRCCDLLRQLPSDRKMRIVEAKSISEHAQVVPLAYVGAPVVSNERLATGTELLGSMEILARYLGVETFDALMGPEIGGMNGMACLTVAAQTGIPVVDADALGRAYPRIDLALPYLFQQATPWPAAYNDGNDNLQVIARASSAAKFEAIARVLSVETGCSSAMALSPMQGNVVHDYCVNGSLSRAWFIGRTISIARLQKTDVCQALVAATPGAFVICVGRISKYERKERGGWTLGEILIRATTADGEELLEPHPPTVLQFQNEYIFAAPQLENGKLGEPICTAPDLISVLDTSGSALGCHELKFGLLVSVIAMPAHRLWTHKVARDAGSPTEFGMDVTQKLIDVERGEWESVIEHYG